MLTADDFFFANDPAYLKMFPDIKRMLIEHESKSKPEECLTCIFLGHRDGKYFCPLGDINFEYGKRAKECFLDSK